MQQSLLYPSSWSVPPMSQIVSLSDLVNSPPVTGRNWSDGLKLPSGLVNSPTHAHTERTGRRLCQNPELLRSTLETERLFVNAFFNTVNQTRWKLVKQEIQSEISDKNMPSGCINLRCLTRLLAFAGMVRKAFVGLHENGHGTILSFQNDQMLINAIDVCNTADALLYELRGTLPEDMRLGPSLKAVFLSATDVEQDTWQRRIDSFAEIFPASNSIEALDEARRQLRATAAFLHTLLCDKSDSA